MARLAILVVLELSKLKPGQLRYSNILGLIIHELIGIFTLANIAISCCWCIIHEYLRMWQSTMVFPLKSLIASLPWIQRRFNKKTKTNEYTPYQATGRLSLS